MQDPKITVRPYNTQDYSSVRSLLEEYRMFDPQMDSEDQLAEKITRDPSSILVAVDEDQIVGTASILEDSRMAFIVRWAGATSEGLECALRSAEEEVFKRGHKQASVLVDARIPKGRELFLDQGYAYGRSLYQMYRELPATLPRQSRR